MPDLVSPVIEAYDPWWRVQWVFPQFVWKDSLVHYRDKVCQSGNYTDMGPCYINCRHGNFTKLLHKMLLPVSLIIRQLIKVGLHLQ